MALGGAALIASWLAAASPAAVPAPVTGTVDAAHLVDFSRLQNQVDALTASTPLTGPAMNQGLMDKAASSVRARIAAAETFLRRVGLDPQRFTGRTAVAVGGPFIPAGGAADARFTTLSMSYQQAAAMEAAIAAIPSYVPVKSYTFTSPFGTRYDPFNGRTAMHAGLDMAGQMGEPIYAAAEGVVVTGGRSGAYGNLVEIDHGKGLATRYGHLSAVLVQPGAHVRQGQLIARMGSTGRSTGTHLHYEIRLDGRAINPRPFLDASAFMLAAQGSAPRGLEGPSNVTLLDLNDDSTTYTLVTKGLQPTLVRN